MTLELSCLKNHNFGPFTAATTVSPFFNFTSSIRVIRAIRG